MTLERIETLDNDPDLAERIDAFVGRFGRLQDTLGDKLLPAALQAVGEPIGPLIDNLDRAEKFGLIASSTEWMKIRKLRNEMIHDYIDDAARLCAALESAHRFVPVLVSTAARMTAEVERRLLQSNS